MKNNIDARLTGGVPLNVLAKLSAEVAYTKKRLCLRHMEEVQTRLLHIETILEEAMRYVEKQTND